MRNKKNRKGLMLLCLLMFSVIMMTSCTKSKMAPDCNDERTKKIVLEKAFFYPLYLGRKAKGKIPEDMILDDFITKSGKEVKLKYSNNKLTISSLEEGESMEINIKEVRTLNINKEIKKYECEASITNIGGKDGKEKIKGPIKYTSEFSDGGSHFVSVMGKEKQLKEFE